MLYQCVITCTSIYPSSQLVELAARAVARFLRSENNNLKYLGITALGSVVSVSARHALHPTRLQPPLVSGQPHVRGGTQVAGD